MVHWDLLLFSKYILIYKYIINIEALDLAKSKSIILQVILCGNVWHLNKKRSIVLLRRVYSNLKKRFFRTFSVATTVTSTQKLFEKKNATGPVLRSWLQ